MFYVLNIQVYPFKMVLQMKGLFRTLKALSQQQDFFCIFLITVEIFASPLVHTDLPYEHHGLIMVIELSRVHCGLKSYK